MIIKVVNSMNEVNCHIEAAYIKWSRSKDFVTIAVYQATTKTRSIGATRESEIVLVTAPTTYLHCSNGDTVYIMNNDGKTIDKKKITIRKLKESIDD
jgi:hypothetical protein